MSRAVAYKCKTPGCDTWLKAREVPKDALRQVTIALKMGDPFKMTCPTCKKEHEYLPAEKQLVEVE